MKITQVSSYLTILLISFCLALSTPSLLVSANLNAAQSNTQQEQNLFFLENFTPPGDGQPKDTGFGGSRDDLSCSPQESSIRALMPQRNYGLTFSPHPAIFFYLPNTSAKQIVVSFRDEAGKYFQRNIVPIKADTDITSASLSNEQPSLEVGKNYQWSVGFVCGTALEPGNPTFAGWVQRVESTAQITKELAQKTHLEQVQWYGAHGYWYDMLSAITQLESSSDAPLWQEILTHLI